MKKLSRFLGLLAILLVVAMLLPGCKKPVETMDVAPVSVTIHLSKAPAVNESVELSLVVVTTEVFKDNVAKMWLQFDRFDPALIYPLGKVANAKEQAVAQLAKQANSIDYLYQEDAESIARQPETKVAAELVAGGGATEWAVTEIMPWKAVTNTTTVSFPETGEWLITGYWEVDGKVEHQGRLRVTVNETDGQIGWQKIYEVNSAPYFFPQPNYPVGLGVDINRAPGLDQETEFTCTLTTTQEALNAELRLTLHHMVGTTQVEIPVEDCLVNGDINWKGELKAGSPTNVKLVLKFPLTGDYFLRFMVFPQIENVGGKGIDFYISVGEKSGRIGWVEDHYANSGYHPFPTVRPADY